MQLISLRLKNFRCFADASLELDPDLNWIVGQNASGKTSLLEALFFLGHGRSFRSSRPDRLIRLGADSFELVANLSNGERRQVLGVGRNEGVTTIRYAGQTMPSRAEAARVLPVVVLDSGMNELVGGGPGERRRWLDWGVFHVEPAFLPVWREYQQALRQRNGALKTGAGARALAPWTDAVARSGEQLARVRREHFDRLQSIIHEFTAIALPEITLSAQFRAGWPEQESLHDALARHLDRDRETGTTRSGPHRSDIQFRVAGLPAEEQLSRGQQKMLAGALWLAQVTVFTESTGERPLLLVDDLAAELDADRLQRFLQLLNRQRAQRVLTAIGDTDIARTGLTGGRVFHVEHGELRRGTPSASR